MARAGDVDGLTAALAAGADANGRDGKGWTALMYAVDRGYTLLARPLLEAGADPNLRAPDGATALFIAAVHGHTEIVVALMEAGADPSIAGPGGKTASDVGRLKYSDGEGARERGADPAVAALLRGVTLAEVREEEERKAREKAERKRREREAREKAERERAALARKWPAGRTFRECDACPEMIVVPAGSFTMGSPASEESRDDSEGPVHRVTIGAPFAVGKYEVTRGEFSRFVEATGHSTGYSCNTYEGDEWKDRPGRGWRNPGYRQDERHPVACVSWDDAQAYVGWLSKKTGKPYRLLSEAEWEYAARAGTMSPFHFGPTISTDLANYNGTHPYSSGRKGVYRKKTVPAGSFPANGFGLHDVHGNVYEWVEDCWNGSYRGASSDGSAWASGDCSVRVLRGGSWFNVPRNLRSAKRIRSGTGYRDVSVGFRIARTLAR